MKKKILIDAIALVARGLESGKLSHNWHGLCSCNAGLLIKAITGKRFDEIHPLIKPLEVLAEENNLSPTWRNIIVCYQAAPEKKTFDLRLFQMLREKGLSFDDIISLEFLSDKKILKRSGIRTRKHFLGIIPYGPILPEYFKQKKNLIKYLKAWKEILLEEDHSSEESAEVFADKKEKEAVEA